jgi:hypothetical protein
VLLQRQLTGNLTFALQMYRNAPATTIAHCADSTDPQLLRRTLSRAAPVANDTSRSGSHHLVLLQRQLTGNLTPALQMNRNAPATTITHCTGSN